jgi:hypothetical protein
MSYDDEGPRSMSIAVVAVSGTSVPVTPASFSLTVLYCFFYHFYLFSSPLRSLRKMLLFLTSSMGIEKKNYFSVRCTSTSIEGIELSLLTEGHLNLEVIGAREWGLTQHCIVRTDVLLNYSIK